MADPKELDLISNIADRALRELPDVVVEKWHWMLDLETAHKDTPLEFARLLAADRFNFAHDMMGIYVHLDRERGVLKDCFCPRFSQRRQAPA